MPSRSADDDDDDDDDDKQGMDNDTTTVKGVWYYLSPRGNNTHRYIYHHDRYYGDPLCGRMVAYQVLAINNENGILCQPNLCCRCWNAENRYEAKCYIDARIKMDD